MTTKPSLSKKIPKRSKQLGQLLRGSGSLSKIRCINYNLDIHLDYSALIQDPLETANDDVGITIYPGNISQLKRKVHDSAAMKEEYAQVIGGLKQQVKDLKQNSNESAAHHTQLVVDIKDKYSDLKDKYSELLRQKQRDKKSVNNVSVCNQLLIVLINNKPIGPVAQ